MAKKIQDFLDEDIQVEDILGLLKKKNRKAVNSNKKGKRGERKICEYLSEKLNNSFSRVPQSGALGTTKNLSEVASRILSGDIICPENFKWSLEIKSGYDIDLINLFYADRFKNLKKDKDLICSFIDQAARDAFRVSLLPMVIYSKDYRTPICIFPFDESLPIKDYMKFSYQPKNLDIWNTWVFVSLEYCMEIFDSKFWFSS